MSDILHTYSAMCENAAVRLAKRGVNLESFDITQLRLLADFERTTFEAVSQMNIELIRTDVNEAIAEGAAGLVWLGVAMAVLAFVPPAGRVQ